MIQFLLGYLLGAGRGLADAPATKLSFADMAALTRFMFTLACAGFMLLILAPLFTDAMPDVLVPTWSWEVRTLAAFGILVVNAAVNIATRAAEQQQW